MNVKLTALVQRMREAATHGSSPVVMLTRTDAVEALHALEQLQQMHDARGLARLPLRRGDRWNSDKDLPHGSTCSDCALFTACRESFGHVAADEVCDWSPSRFHRARPAQPVFTIHRSV